MEKDPLEKIQLSAQPSVSVVIPHFSSSRSENLSGLLQDLKTQTFQAIEIILVKGVSPQGRAINQGVREAQGKILVIIDDDSRLGHARVIENLVQTLRRDPTIGMAGASIIPSERDNWFQRRAAQEFPRYQMTIVKEVTESDLPGHPCVAFPMEAFMKAGREREDILRGLDPDLRVRIRKAGYRVVLVPDTWAHHPLPSSIGKFVRTFLRNGYGSAYLQVKYPEINYDTDESVDSGAFVAKRPFFYRALRYPLRLLESLVTFQWIRLLGYTVYLIGYVGGYIENKFHSRLRES